MNAEPVTEGTYSISQSTDGTFQVRGGSLEGDGMSTKDLTDAIDKILEVDKKVTINFDNISISGDGPVLKQGCELTLTGSYKKNSAGAALYVGAKGNYIIHNKANIKTVGDNYLYYRKNDAKDATVLFEQEAGELTAGFNLTAKDTVCLKGGTINGRGFGNGGNGHIEITDGIWNGQLSGIKKIDISGGEVKYKAEETDDVTAIEKAKKFLSVVEKFMPRILIHREELLRFQCQIRQNYHYQIILIYLLQVKIRMDRYIMVTVLNPVLLLML